MFITFRRLLTANKSHDQLAHLNISFHDNFSFYFVVSVSVTVDSETSRKRHAKLS